MSGRREFIIGGGAMFAAAGMGRFAFGGVAAGDAKLRVGVLSDIHVNSRDGAVEGCAGADMLEKALRYFGGRENSRIFGVADTRTQQMPYLGCGDGHHGQVMTVYDDQIILERRDFENDLPVGPDWIVPLPAASASFAKRGESAAVPQFAADAKVSVSRIDGKNRRGEPTKQVVIAFPNVRGLDGGARAFDYEVRVEATEVDRTKTWMTKRVYSPHYYWAAEKDDETVTCLFAVSELPAPNGEREPGRGTVYRFAVSPANSFGGQGKTIYSEMQV